MSEICASFSCLKDFDWSLRLTLSSDKISGLRKPLLLLKIDTVGPDGGKVERIVEMNEEELNHLLARLKEAQEVLKR